MRLDYKREISGHTMEQTFLQLSKVVIGVGSMKKLNPHTFISHIPLFFRIINSYTN